MANFGKVFLSNIHKRFFLNFCLNIDYIYDLESTQRVQTFAEYFRVLLLAVYRNHNSKSRILLKLLDPEQYLDPGTLDRHQNLIDLIDLTTSATVFYSLHWAFRRLYT